MEKFINWFSNIQWRNLITSTSGIIGIILAIIFFFKSRKRKSPVFCTRSFNVFSENKQKISGIDVEFKGKKVENLTITNVAFWNDGNEVINFCDLAPSDTTKIVISEKFKILESKLVFKSHETNDFKLNSTSDKQVDLSFEYINPKQGCIIKLIHTGNNSSDIKMTGTFKGVRTLKNLNNTLFNFSLHFNNNIFNRIYYRIMNMLLLIVSLGMVYTGFLSNELKSSDIVFIVFGFLNFIFALIMIYYNKALPKDLKKYFYDE